jgi:hypothetical protein
MLYHHEASLFVQRSGISQSVQVVGPNGLLVAASVLGPGSNPLSDADAFRDLASVLLAVSLRGLWLIVVNSRLMASTGAEPLSCQILISQNVVCVLHQLESILRI